MHLYQYPVKLLGFSIYFLIVTSFIATFRTINGCEYILENNHLSVNFVGELIMDKLYKIEFYVPESHLEVTKKALFDIGAGRIGNYDSCCWETLGTGQFRPLEDSNPYQGKSDYIEKIKEYKIELVCKEALLKDSINAIKKTHPYETPAYNYWAINL